MNGSHRFTATDAVRLIVQGRLTAVDLAQDCLAQIERREPDIQAWSWIDREQVLAQARTCDRETRRLPLLGIPVGIKDVIETCDMPTAYGSPIYAGHRPAADAACVALLREAGAVIMGKTVTVEFAMRHPGATRNPHNTQHTPGGSSSGSAAAVADFMAPLALGTQTGGSTVRPAAFCGTVGFKPSFNVINRAGVKPVAESLDTVGLFARTVTDARLIFSVLTDRVAPAGHSGGSFIPRIGFCRTAQWTRADAATAAALEGAASALGKAGAEVRDVALPEPFDAMLKAHACISDYESCRAFAHERRHFSQQLSKALIERFDKADRRTLADYVHARQVAADCRRRLRDVFSEFDVLMTPSAPGVAPAGLQSTGDSIFNRMWTALHTPAVTLPLFSGPGNLPIGLQLVGAFGADEKVLAAAEWVWAKLA